MKAKRLLFSLFLKSFFVALLLSVAVDSVAQPTGAINSLFSVAEGQYVCFSQGNLQYNAAQGTHATANGGTAQGTWRFAEHQGDIAGTNNHNISETYSGWIDLFGYGTSGWNSGVVCYQPWSVSNTASDYLQESLTGSYANADWGVYNAISNGGNQPGLWRTLTSDEWNYILNGRPTNSGIRYVKATVNGMCGLILLPDAWNENVYPLNRKNAYWVQFDTNVISASDWTNVLEAHGAVFLPVANNRVGSSYQQVLGQGLYRTANPDGVLNFYDVNSYGAVSSWVGVTSSGVARYFGYSVRLVNAPSQSSIYSITTGANPSTGGKIAGAGAYMYGAQCTLHATPNGHYTFVRWLKNGSQVSTNPTYSFTVTENANYVAEFAAPTGGTGQLNGVFSIAANSQVNFSKGNLQYQASTSTWRFAMNQYEHMGVDNENVSPVYGGWIDLFGWGTSGYNHGAACYQPYSVSANNSDYYAYGQPGYNLFDQSGKADWGYNAISNGGNSTNSGWRTLTKEEWNYLFNTRVTISGIRYAKAKVNGIGGVILLPDDWNASLYSLEDINNSYADYLNNNITDAEWTDIFETAGAVFLPAVGRMVSGSIVEEDEFASMYKSFGFYWSSSCYDNDRARGLYFYGAFDGAAFFLNDSELSASSLINRSNGASVRLVRSAQNTSFVIKATPFKDEFGTVTGSGSYQPGQYCTVTAAANTGYVFECWTEDDVQVSTNPTYGFSVTGSRALVAHFKCVINASADPSNGGIVNGTGNYEYASYCTLTAVPSGNYVFMYWTEDGMRVSNDAQYTFSVYKTHNLVAHFSSPFSISAVSAPAAGGSVYGTGSYFYNTTCTLMATANEGYVFAGWTENGSTVSIDASYSFTVTGNRSLTANFTTGVDLGLPSGRLWAPYNVGSCSPEEYGSYFAWAETQPKSSYSWATYQYTSCDSYYCLTKYCYDGDFGIVDDLTVIESSDDAATAYWGSAWHIPTQEEWQELLDNTTSTWTTQNGVDGRLFTAANGNSIFLPAAGHRVNSGLEYSGSLGYYWSSTLNNNSPQYAVILGLGSNVCYMHLTSQRYYGQSVRPVSSGPQNLSHINAAAIPATGGTVSGAGYYSHGTSVQLVATTNPGYTFVRWTKNGVQVSTNPNLNISVTGSAIYVAEFVENCIDFEDENVKALCLAHWDTDGSGELNYAEAAAVTSLGSVFRYNGDITSFDELQYFTGLTSIDSWAFFDCSSLTSVTIPNSVTSIGSYAFVDCSGLTSITVLAETPPTLDGSYVFMDVPTGIPVYVPCSSITSYQTTDGWSAFTNYHGIDCPYYEVVATVNPTSGGAVSGTGSYENGSICTLTAVPNSGYNFSNWTENGNVVFTDANYAFTVTSDRNLVANFTLIPVNYTISVSANPSNGGTVSGGGSFGNGSTCTITALANTGYVFDYWTENGAVVSTAATYSFEVTGSHNLVAVFSVANGTGILSGVFSVDENTHVNFSQGNLQYQASTNTWRFAANQWDCIGGDNSNVSETYSGWIDLFCWGTSGYNHGAVCYQPWSTSNSSSDYYAYGSDTYNLYDQTGQADWGYNSISNGGNELNQWRTLTSNEWAYVFTTRTTSSGIRFAKANVNNVNGVILLPDDWDASYYNLSNTNIGDAGFDSNSITASQWSALEQHGAVFLPAAGYRFLTTSGTYVGYVNSYLNYWSSSCSDSNNAYGLAFFDFAECFNPQRSLHRYFGQSVRLARNAQNLTYDINATPYPTEGGTISGAGTYQQGQNCTLMAVANPGYTFENWTENGTIVSVEANYSFEVTGNRALVVNFTDASGDGKLSGVFSVSENSCVSFAQGNLQYQASSDTWRFATNQYDYVGSYNANISETYSGWIDLFGWGTSGYNHGAVCYQPWSVSASANDYFAYGSYTNNLYDGNGQADWGYNAVANGGNAENNGWRTLTQPEWNYVFNTRSTSSGIRWAKGTVNGVVGVILLPDNWDASFYTLSDTNTNSANFSSNTISAVDWTNILEANGAVFLPAVGHRDGTSVSNDGSYWSASYYNSYGVYGLYISDSGLGTSNIASRSYGRSVRLVRPPQNNSFGINATPNPAEGGTVSGTGIYLEGVTCTLTATANEGYYFLNWMENGQVVSTEASYSFVVEAGRDLVAHFALNCTTDPENIQVNNIGYTNATVSWTSDNDLFELRYRVVEGFENGMPDDWATIDADGDGYTWVFGANGATVFAAHNSNYCASSASYINNVGALTPDNYLVTPQMNLGGVFGFYACAQDANYAAEYFGVAVSTGSQTNADDFTMVQEWTMSSKGTATKSETRGGNRSQGKWYYYSVDLSAYAGQTGYIAIRHFNCTDMYYLNVDDIYYGNSDEWTTVTGITNTSYTLTGLQENKNYVVEVRSSCGDGNNYSNWTGASFSNRRFTVTAVPDPVGGGAVVGEGEYLTGTTCTLVAEANEGYTFINWTENGNHVSSNAQYSFAVIFNRELVAHFTLPLNITATANIAEGGTVTGTGAYDYGSTCTLTATPNEGYLFLHWSRNGEVVGNNASYSFTVTGEADYVAVFMLLDGTLVGGGEATNVYLPSYSYYKHSLSQQIYTPGEIGGNSVINSISFFNAGATKTRNYDIYIVHTDKTAFDSNYDWITVTESDRVFSGDVTMTSNYWTTIVLNTPFNYNGTSNIAIVIDDNSGNYTGSPHMACRVFETNAIQAIRVYGDGINYDPSNPSGYGGTRYSVKNQIVINMPLYNHITASANPANGGTVSGIGSYPQGSTCTLTATPNEGYAFVNWTENEEVVSTNSVISFVVEQDRALVAMFAEVVVVGDGGTATNSYLPSFSYYNYTLSQQIYTADEICVAGTITTIAFYNGGSSKTRNYDVYLVHTDKTDFSNNTDWITVTENDKVFSGNVDMISGDWTVLHLDTPFNYDGMSNLAIVVDDNSGNWSSGMACRVFDAPNQAIRVYGDGTNYDPYNPSGYNGTVLGVKNQIQIGFSEINNRFALITATANPVEGGAVSGVGYLEQGQTCTLTATASEGYYFVNWTENGAVVSTDPEFSFVVEQSRNLVAAFAEVIVVGNEGDATNQYLPSYSFYNYSLTQQIYTVEEIGVAGTINSIAFYNGGSQKTRNYDVYLVHTDKTDFSSNWDWINVTANDKVFSGNVDMVVGDWTVLYLNTPFEYNGMSNLAIVVDDNSGNWSSPSMACRVYDAPNQAIRVYGDGTNYNPTISSEYSGTVLGVKNQIQIGFVDITNRIVGVAATANPTAGGAVSGAGSYLPGVTCTLTAVPSEGYLFLNWSVGGEVVCCNADYSFTVSEAVDVEAVFMPLEGILIGDGEETSQYLPGYGPDNTSQYSLSQQIYTAGEIGGSSTITSISFYNAGETRVHNFNIYMAHTAKTVFDSDTDWIDVSEADRVFNGYVTMTKGYWTTIKLDRPFAYDGVNNLAIVVDDNTGSSGMSINCRVFNASGNQTLSVWNQSGNANFNPYDPESNQGSLLSVKNQIILNKNSETPSLHVYAGYYPDANNPGSPYVKVEWEMETSKGAGAAKLDPVAYSVYRSSCDGSGMQLIADNLTENQYIDTDWTTLTPGGFKYAVSVLPSDNLEVWNLIGGYHCSSGYQYGVASDGINVYHSAWSSNAGFQFAKYDMEGNFIETFDVAGCGYLRDMTYDGQYFYGGASDSTLYCVDLSNKQLVSTTATACDAVRYCAYDSMRDGFWVGNWNTSIMFINRSGEAVIIGPAGNAISGAAYYKDQRNVEHVYLFAQPNQNAVVYDYNIANNTISSTPIYYVSDNLPGTTGESGGCFIGEAFGKIVLFAAVQQSPNYVGVFELNPLTWSDCIEKPSSIAQSTALNNGWNWWSTYIEQGGADGLTQMEESLGNNGIMIKSRENGFVTNYGDMWLGSLTSVNNESTYLIQTAAACEMTVTGAPAATASHPITLSPGWNWIGYPCGTSMSVDAALSGLTPQENDQLKARDNFSIYYPGIGWLGTLQTVTPGMGLMFESHNTSNVTLTYPATSKSETLLDNITSKGNHWIPAMQRYPYTMTVLGVVEFDGGELDAERYELGVFADGECRGSVKLIHVDALGRSLAFLTVYGEEPVELNFGLYDSETGEERYDSRDIAVFTTNATLGSLEEPYKIRFRSMSGVDDLNINVKLYPNPVEQGQTFTLDLKSEEQGEIQVEIINAFGVVETKRIMFQPTTIAIKAPNTPGVYVVRVTLNGKKTCFRKLIVE